MYTADIHTVLLRKILTHEDIVFLLSDKDENVSKIIFDHARAIANDRVGKRVYLRGLIELSNVCAKDCYYCGIRKSNSNIRRYTLSKSEAFEAIARSHESGYGSIVLQAGENTSAHFISFVEECIRYAHEISNGTLGITLSLGEQHRAVYKRLFDAGAHRYLLRIETSDPVLYSQLHPSSHSFESRKKCLFALKEIGYQVGTGVIIGLPGQTIEHLAGDVQFFNEMDVDMIGMGPYIVHNDTPLGAVYRHSYKANTVLRLSLLMIAVTRIVCGDCNIAATTALEVLDASARIKGILAGANIIMINMTPQKFRDHYYLYEGKIHAGNAEYLSKIEEALSGYGITIAYTDQGNPPHYHARRGDHVGRC